MMFNAHVRKAEEHLEYSRATEADTDQGRWMAEWHQRQAAVHAQLALALASN